jgi:protoporphyrinogen/coproporphyrinogen III oxidase
MGGGTMRVVVIGGGLSGLATAHAVIREANREGRSLRLTLLEASSRLGGNIHTLREDGFVIESGPDAFVVTRPQALHLCEELGLGPRLIETVLQNRKVYVVRNGKLTSMPEGLVLGIPSRIRPFLRSPLLSMSGKLRALREVVERTVDAGGDISVGEFLERRFGREMVDIVLEPLLGGIYAGDAYRLSLRSTFPDWFKERGRGASLLRSVRAEQKGKGKKGPPRSPFRSLAGGMGELVDALARSIGDGVVRFGTAAKSIERQGRAYRVILADGELEADQVVVALPSRLASQLLATCDETLARELGAIEYVSTATVCFAYQRSQIAHPLDAVGFLVPKNEGRRITGGTFISSKWPGRAPSDCVLLRAFVGGAHDEATPGLDDAELIALVRGELAALLGIQGVPRFAKVFRYPKASPQPHVGHADRVARIRTRLEALPGLHVIGNAYDGVGIPDCVRLAEQTAAQIRSVRGAGGRSSTPPPRSSTPPPPPSTPSDARHGV